MSLAIAGLFVGALLAFALSAVSGGGAGLLLLPLLNALLPGAQVPAALSLGTASSSVSRILAFRQHIRWDVVAWFVPPALPAVWLGAWLLQYVNPLYLELLMGGFLLANLPLLFRPAGELRTIHPLGRPWLLALGAATGFVSGLTGAVGLLFNRFYLRYGLNKEQIVATRAANEVLLQVVKLGLYASFGLLSNRALSLGAIVAVAAVLASGVMRWLLPRLSEDLFRRIGYGAMVVSGLSLFSGTGVRLLTTSPLHLSLQPISGGLETQWQWKQGWFALEFEYDEGPEYERTITLQELPAARRAQAHQLSLGADKVTAEEVFGIGKHYYELYVYRGGQLSKYDLP